MSFNLATILRESALPARGPGGNLHGRDHELRRARRAVGRFSAGLRAAGLEPGDVVAVQLPNLPQFLVAYFGVLKAGMTLLPINPLLKAPEITYHLETRAKLLVTFEMFLAEPRHRRGRDPALRGLLRAQLSDGAPVRRPDVEGPRQPGGIPTNSDDTAVLIYTSGTTGKPKGAKLTHFQLYMNCSVAGRLFGAASTTSRSRRCRSSTCSACPRSSTSRSLRRRLSIVPRFEPKAVLDAIEADRVSVIPGVPTMLRAGRADTAGRDLSRLRVAVSGGASLPGEVMRAFEAKFGIVVLEGYGLSETASTAASTSARRSASCSRSASRSGRPDARPRLGRQRAAAPARRTSGRSSSAATTS